MFTRRVTEEQYEKHVFSRTHEPISCCGCHDEILPGDPILLVDGKDYCSYECFAESHGGYSLTYENTKEEYTRRFENGH